MNSLANSEVPDETERTVDGAPSQIPTLKSYLLPPPPHSTQVPRLEHDPGDRINIPFDMFYIYYCENTTTVWYRNLRIECVMKLNNISIDYNIPFAF